MSGAPEAAQEPLPVGAFFEAAFRRFGARFVGYELYTIAFALVPALTASALRGGDVGGRAAWASLGFGYLLGHLLLVGTLAALVTGTLRSRLLSALTVCLAGALVAGAIATLFPPLVLLVYPVLAFAVIAAATGDASAAAALPYAARLAGRNVGRCLSVLLGIVIVGAVCWFGFVIALSPVGGSNQQLSALTLTTLIAWPVVALVMRNCYGDLTGRVVLRREELAPERRPAPRRRP